MTVKPVRLQLSRSKGFDLQAASNAINGLPALVCSRPGRRGNPFAWQLWTRVGGAPGTDVALLSDDAKKVAVSLYRRLIEGREIPSEWESVIDRYYRGEPVPTLGEIALALDGRNGACWCGPADTCHVDLQLAWTARWFG